MELLDLQNNISSLLAMLYGEIYAHRAQSRTDINHAAEDLVVPLLAEVYGYTHLRNLNLTHPNFPSVDLVDDVAKVAIQVTSTRTSDKIKKTLQKFVETDLHTKYNRVIIYILTNKQRSYKSRSFDEITKDKIGFDPNRDVLDYTDIAAKVRSLDIKCVRRIERILKTSVGGRPGVNDPQLVLTDPRPILKRYLNLLINTSSQVDLRGIGRTGRPISLDLTQVYIPLLLHRGVDQPHLSEQDIDQLWRTARRVEGFDDLSAGGLWFEDGERATIESTSAPPSPREPPFNQAQSKAAETTLYDALRENKAIVIVGEPGSGKTTLVRFLTLLFSQAALSLADEDGSKEVRDKVRRSDGSARLPIPIRMASYDQALENRPDLSLGHFLDSEFRDIEGIGKILREEIAGGRALLLLDGLDEVIDANRRLRMIDLINSFVAANITAQDGGTGNSFIVTSRIAPYRFASLSPKFVPFTLTEFTQDQTRLFLMQWFLALENSLAPSVPPALKRKRAAEQTRLILEAMSESTAVSRLASRPLTLTILAVIQRNGLRLPRRRVELYELAVRVLIDHWEQARNTSSTKTLPYTLTVRLLSRLACWMNSAGASGISNADEVRQMLFDILPELQGFQSGFVSAESVDDFIERVRDRTGILVEESGGVCGFSHSAFRDYFAARWLVERQKEAAKRILECRHLERWTEPVLLAVAFVNKDHPEDSADLIRTAVLTQPDEAISLGLTPGGDKALRQRDILLAARCLADCSGIDQELLVDVIGQLITLYLSDGSYSDDGISRGELDNILEYLRSSEAGNLASRLLCRKLTSVNSVVRARAASGLMALRASIPEVAEALIRMLESEESGEVRDIVKAAIIGLGVPSVVEVFLKEIDEKHDHPRAAYVRRVVVQALGKSEPVASQIPTALLKVLEDTTESIYVRGQAALALEEYALASKQIMSVLLDRLTDASAFVRACSALVLKKLCTNRSEHLTSDGIRRIKSRLKPLLRDVGFVGFIEGRHYAHVCDVLADL